MSLRVSAQLELPCDVVTETIGILGMRGAGKSTAAVVLAEEMHAAHLPWVAIDPKGDWWGIRAAATDGKTPNAGLPVPVFGGLHGDLPLEPTAGALVADLIVESNLTAVVDVSDFTKSDRSRFLVDFFERLYRRHRADPQPRHVFLEEAHEYIPQQVMAADARLKEAAARIVLQGRTFGLGTSTCSQRSARLHKDVLTQIGTLIAMRTTAPQDRKAILAWVEEHDLGRELVASLPELADGEAWIWSPRFLQTTERFRFRTRHTFDSGGTPKIGKARAPATLADVDLAVIKEQMAATIEKAKADDPYELRRRISALERELKTARDVASAPEPVEVIREIEIIPGELIAVVNQARVALLDAADTLVRTARELEATEQRAHERNADSRGSRQEAPVRASAAEDRGPSRPAARVKAAPATQTVPPAPRSSEAGTLPDGERKILTVVAQYPQGATREQLTVLTGYKRSSRDTYIQRLRSRGLIETSGTLITPTVAAIPALGAHFTPLPRGAELQSWWLSRLPVGEAMLLQCVFDAYPNPVSRERLTELTDYKRSSRDTYLQRLRSRQLITSSPDGVRAADTLMED